MIAHSPSDCAFFTGSRGLVGLAFYTKVHDVISADSTIVNHYVPSPQSNSIPFFDFESFLSTLFTRSSRNFEITVHPIFNLAKYMYFSLSSMPRSFSTKAVHCTCVDTKNCPIKPTFELANSICETYTDCWCPINL